MGRRKWSSDTGVTLVRSVLDERVWSPVFEGTEVAHSLDHAGGLRAVKAWSEREFCRMSRESGLEFRWVTGEGGWVKYLEIRPVDAEESR